MVGPAIVKEERQAPSEALIKAGYSKCWEEAQGKNILKVKQLSQIHSTRGTVANIGSKNAPKKT